MKDILKVEHTIISLTLTLVKEAAMIHQKAFQHDTIGGAGGWNRATIASAIKHHHGMAVLWKNSLAGFVVWQRLASDQHEILTLAIDPSYQRQGMATALIHAATPIAGELLLEVAANNTPAIQLYKKLGFTERGSRPKYYPGDVDALIMASVV